MSAIPSPGNLVPSPMLSDGPRPVPPGGHSFVLSPPRLRAPVRPPSPPISSSIPQEAIQAEVQRQLGGLLERLQRAEGHNHRGPGLDNWPDSRGSSVWRRDGADLTAGLGVPVDDRDQGLRSGVPLYDP